MKIDDLTLDTDELDAFMASRLKNQRIWVGPYFMYVRKGSHMIDRKLRKTFDVGSIKHQDRDENVYWEKSAKRPSRGQFRELMALLEQCAKAAGLEAVFVESISNEFLPEVLTGYGYKRVEDAQADVHYVKFI